MNLLMSPLIQGDGVYTGLPELSGPIGKIFDILRSDSETNNSSDKEEHYDMDEMYGSDCKEDNAYDNEDVTRSCEESYTDVEEECEHKDVIEEDETYGSNKEN